MTNEERIEYAKHRIKSAHKTFEAAEVLAELFDWRQKGDYDNIFDYDNDSVKPLFKPVSELIDLIEKEIYNTLKNPL